MPPQGVVTVQQVSPLFGFGENGYYPEGPPPEMMPGPGGRPGVMIDGLIVRLACGAALAGLMAGVGFRAYKSSGSAQRAGIAVATATFALGAARHLWRESGFGYQSRM